METSDPSGRLAVEDLSDCRSESSHSESQMRAFQDYERIKELNLSVDKSKDDCQIEPKDFHLGLESGRSSIIRFDEFENIGRNHPLTLNKGKEFGYVAAGLNEMAYTLDRSSENDESLEAGNLCRTKNPTAKDLLFNLRENRHKSAHATLSLSDRYAGKDLNFAVSEKDIKDFGLLKNYSIDRMKEFNLSLDRMRDSHFALERLRGGGGGLLENPPMLEHGELKNMQMQSRSQDLEAIALERMRRSHLLGADLSAQNLSTQIPHPHSITQMQHSQQQQQQQAKSFTIDAILGLRNNPREKRNQQQQYRKHQGTWWWIVFLLAEIGFFRWNI